MEKIIVIEWNKIGEKYPYDLDNIVFLWTHKLFYDKITAKGKKKKSNQKNKNN